MSNQSKEDTLPKKPADLSGEAPPARKRAVKKTAANATEPSADTPAAKKTVAKKAAKKAAAKKTAAKKVARKSAASKGPITPDLPFDSPVDSKPVPAPEVSEARPAKVAAKKVAKKAAKKAATSETADIPAAAPQAVEPPARESREEAAPQSESSAQYSDAPRRGRVPGGGPVGRERAERHDGGHEEPQGEQRRHDGQRGGRDNRPHPNDRQRQHHQDGNGPSHGGQSRDGQPSNQGQGQGPRESRSKRRREKRKRRNQERLENSGRRHDGPPQHSGNQGEREERRHIQVSGPAIEANGMLELAPKGFGFLRVPEKNFEQARDDIFVTPETIRKFNLRPGQWIHGSYQQGPRGPQLVEITKINDITPEEASKLPHFDELKAINPSKRISFETSPERFTTRIVDIMAPVGRGQRGLIVSPPRSGKTTLLLHMAEAIREKYEESIHLMVVLVDERPEEVTEFRRALPGAEIYASSNDEHARSHTRIAEMAIERAKRLVEAGRDVFLIMDSITRLARAYNGNMNNRGRGTGSGGITIGALEVPRRLFAAARNTRGGGSLTILATALIQTNSRADEAIFMEFKGTGNMELVLDRKIAENYVYPAVDIFKSGTRREELLLPEHMLHKIHLIRRGLSGHRPMEAMERLLFFLKKFPNNPQMLLEIKG